MTVTLYRVRQFVRALTARISEEELEQVAQTVSPPVYALFRSMALQDQRHSLDVYATLRLSGWERPELLTAALLHDVGKSLAPLPAWQRALIVLLSRFLPRLMKRLERKRGFAIHAHHAELGARLAQQAGCSPLVVSLIRRHHEDGREKRGELLTEEDVLLAALQAADSAN